MSNLKEQNRINHILNNLTELAAGNFEIDTLNPIENDTIGAIDSGIYMLAEQLKHEKLEQVKLLKEKEVLMQEIHHRVKNNLQIITSLMNIQSEQLNDNRIKDLFQKSKNRIESIGIVHEILHRSKNMTEINFNEYIKILVNNLVRSLDDKNKLIIDFNLIEIQLNLDISIPLGLMINEMITNSIKHGFVNQPNRKISISLEKLENHNLLLIISDNGSGFDENDFNKLNSLGLELISILSEQINSVIEKESSGKGTTYKIKFSSNQT